MSKNTFNAKIIIGRIEMRTRNSRFSTTIIKPTYENIFVF